MVIDLLPFVVEALGYNAKIRSDIDRLYQTNKYEFYSTAKKHELYKHQIVTEGSLLQEEYCKKALGILLCAGDETIATSLWDIFRKGWTYAYLFVENNQEIDLGKFLKNSLRKAGGLNEVSDDWLNSQILLVYFLAVNAGKKIVVNEWTKTFEEGLIKRWQHYGDDDRSRISLKNATTERLKIVKNLKNQIFAKYGRFTNFVSMYGKLRKRAETMALLYDYEKLSCESVFDTVKLSEKSIEEILLAYQGRYGAEDIDQAADFLCDAMYVRYMAKAYNEVKRHYFKNNRETAYVELEGMKKELLSADQEMSNMQSLLTNTQESLKSLEKEKKRLESELAEEKKHRQELNSLREFLFDMDRQEKFTGEASIDIDAFKDFRAVIIGGHEKWQARMKELLPNVVFIHPDNINFDLRLLGGVRTVLIYPNYLNHSIYYRAMNSIAGSNIRIGYINQRNDNLVLQEIARFLD